ncbi:hydrogenase expression protein HupH [Thioclava sp. BHET1]|nr:hydrogenase expression protein HupH [Thioclava sp. BHET1]
MRLLLVNPNMTVAMTERMTGLATDLADGRAQIVPLTAPRGFPYIASRAEAQIAGALALEMIAEHSAGADGAIIAAFGDPGLVAARELFDFPVVGMSEAAMMTAALLGDRFSVITFSPAMTRWYEDSIASSGLQSRSCGVRAAQLSSGNVATAREETRAQLIALARASCEEDGADVIILGGAPLAGLAAEIAAEVPALVVDPISAATAQVMALATLTSGLNYTERRNRPCAKPSVGLSAPLRAIIAQGAI